MAQPPIGDFVTSTKHLALSSQALSFIIALMPYVREFFRRHLSQSLVQQTMTEFENVKPLAEEIIDTLIDLLFFSDFTLPKVPAGKHKVTYAIWQSGVGCNTAMGSNKTLENNRCEILRLLLTMTGKAMYLPSSMFRPFRNWGCQTNNFV